MELSIDFNVKDVLSNIDEITEEMTFLIDSVIYNWLNEVADHASKVHPWRNRTGALAESHFVEPIDDGWRLRIDPRDSPSNLNPNATVNYGAILERTGWSWVAPAIERFKPQLELDIKDAIDKMIKTKAKVTKHTRAGKERVVMRYPAGSVDPITGKKRGGQFI